MHLLPIPNAPVVIRSLNSHRVVHGLDPWTIDRLCRVESGPRVKPVGSAVMGGGLGIGGLSDGESVIAMGGRAHAAAIAAVAQLATLP